MVHHVVQCLRRTGRLEPGVAARTGRRFRETVQDVIQDGVDGFDGHGKGSLVVTARLGFYLPRVPEMQHDYGDLAAEKKKPRRVAGA